MMGVRVVCFLLMVLITPYGWYTWLLGAAAVVLPYLAVVLANVGQDGRDTRPENPERALPAASGAPSTPAPVERVIRISEGESAAQDDEA